MIQRISALPHDIKSRQKSVWMHAAIVSGDYINLFQCDDHDNQVDCNQFLWRSELCSDKSVFPINCNNSCRVRLTLWKEGLVFSQVTWSHPALISVSIALSQTPAYTVIYWDYGYRDTISCGVSVYCPALASTHCTYPRWDGQAELTVGLGDWLHTEVVCSPADGHPPQY